MYTIDGALILGLSEDGAAAAASVDWYRMVGTYALGDAERKDEADARLKVEAEEEDALNDDGSCLFDAAERHRDESRRRDVAMVQTEEMNYGIVYLSLKWIATIIDSTYNT
mmetsp:Transcript_33364/g.80699  ORF Transcript_33364/g.80699 Transcript_33364/m.80699 type:complete len:111 (-) Transcript_33364:50-382(-)